MYIVYKQILLEIRMLYFMARHVCFGYQACQPTCVAFTIEIASGFKKPEFWYK